MPATTITIVVAAILLLVVFAVVASAARRIAGDRDFKTRISLIPPSISLEVTTPAFARPYETARAREIEGAEPRGRALGRLLARFLSVPRYQRG